MISKTLRHREMRPNKCNSQMTKMTSETSSGANASEKGF